MDVHTDGIVDSSPAISADGQTIYVGGHDNKLHAVKAADGTARWAAPYATGGVIYSSPLSAPMGLRSTWGATTISSTPSRLLTARRGGLLPTPRAIISTAPLPSARTG